MVPSEVTGACRWRYGFVPGGVDPGRAGAPGVVMRTDAAPKAPETAPKPPNQPKLLPPPGRAGG